MKILWATPRAFELCRRIALSFVLCMTASLLDLNAAAAAGRVGYQGGVIGSGRDNSGWTKFALAPDARAIHVSSSEGSDANDGRSESSPKRTLKAAAALTRKGYGDWLLLRRGDTWTDESLSGLLKSGRSAQYPSLLGAYGTEGGRPLLKVTSPFVNIIKTIENVAITDIHLLAYKRDPTHPTPQPDDFPCASIILNSGANILLEGMKFEYCGLAVQGDLAENGTGRINNVMVRRSAVAYAYAGGGAHMQGIYAQGIDNLLLEENVFYQNGWNPLIGAPPDIFKHGLYLQYTNANVSVIGNLIAESSSNGLQQRSGGVTLDNLFVRNGIAAYSGTTGSTQKILKDKYRDTINPVTGKPYWSVDDIIFAENIALDPDNILPKTGSDALGDGGSGLPRGFGFEIKHASRAWVLNNIIANRRANIQFEGGTGAFIIGSDVNADASYEISGNIVHDHGKVLDLNFSGSGRRSIAMTGNVFQETRRDVLSLSQDMPFLSFRGNLFPAFQTSRNLYYDAVHPQCALNSENGVGMNFKLIRKFDSSARCRKRAFPDPERNLGSYMGTLGLVSDTAAFWQQALNLSKNEWDPRFTAATVNAYLRQGFGRSRSIFDTDALAASLAR